MSITLEKISFQYPPESRREKESWIFKDFCAEFQEKRVTAILGPSGCGKTTLLRLMDGTLTASAGSISGVSGRLISTLFQEPRLLPWRSVEQNIAIVLPEDWQPDQKNTTVQRWLERVELSEKSGAYPGALSGGQRQRAAIARAFAYPGDFLVMDEPFQALDLKLKMKLVRTFQDLWKDDKRTALFITHDIHEALILGDSITVLDGRPVQIVKSFENPVKSEERSLTHPEIMNLEKELYTLLS